MKQISDIKIWEYINNELSEEEFKALSRLIEKDRELASRVELMEQFDTKIFKYISFQELPPSHMMDNILDGVDFSRYSDKSIFGINKKFSSYILLHSGLCFFAALYSIVTKEKLTFINSQPATINYNIILLFLISSVIALATTYIIKLINYKRALSGVY